MDFGGKDPYIFFSSKPVLIDFCLTFQTEDSKPFPKSSYDFCIYMQHYVVWLVHEFFKIFSLFFWPLDFLTLFSVFVAFLATPTSNHLLNISAGIPYRNLNNDIQHAQAEFNIFLICLNLLHSLYSFSISTES